MQFSLSMQISNYYHLFFIVFKLIVFKVNEHKNMSDWLCTLLSFPGVRNCTDDGQDVPF